MKIYCRKEMIYPVVRMKDDQAIWGTEFRHDKTEIREWIDVCDSDELKAVLARYKAASREFKLALDELNKLLKAGKKGRD